MARNEELEARLRSHPDDPEAYLIYADWLSEQGDPRGELIALQDQRARIEALQASERAVLSTHAADLLGPLAEVDPRRFEVTWSRGFVRDLTMRPFGAGPGIFARVVVDVLAHPSFQILRSLSFVVEPRGQMPLAPALQIAGLPETLTSLSLGLVDAQPSLRGPILGRPLERLAETPRLEALTLHGHAELTRSELPMLRSVRLFGGAAQAGDLLSLERQAWPSLSRLELFLGDEGWNPTQAARELLPILDRAFPSLSHLRLAGAMPRPTAEALLDSRLLRRLDSLALTDGSADPSAVVAFASAPDAFGNLERLDLSGNGLGEGVLQDLSVLDCEVLVGAGRATGNGMVCSFCGRAQAEVRRLIAGPSVFICDECVALCGDILDEAQ